MGCTVVCLGACVGVQKCVLVCISVYGCIKIVIDTKHMKFCNYLFCLKELI